MTIKYHILNPTNKDIKSWNAALNVIIDKGDNAKYNK
jgi:hypothetical protein